MARVPFNLTPMARVKKGMSIDEVRQVWLPLAEAKTKEIIGKYYAQRPCSGAAEKGVGRG